MTMTVDVTAATAVAAVGAYIDAVHADELFVDQSYQRPVDMGRARKLAAAWDRRLGRVIEFSDRGQGQHPRYAVIDGQHRWEAARRRDPQALLVASIHEKLSVADEARLFDRLNRERRRPSTWDHRHARKGSGDPEVLAIEQVVSDLGLRIDAAPREGNMRCTATLERLAALGGVELVRETLQLIVGLWDLRLDAFDAPIVYSIGLIQHHLRDRIDAERLADALLGVIPLALRTHAAALGETVTGPRVRGWRSPSWCSTTRTAVCRANPFWSVRAVPAAAHAMPARVLCRPKPRERHAYSGFLRKRGVL
jgi:hypothetical protein